MNKDEVTALVQSILQSGQYSVTKVPYHIHNNIDAPFIPSTNITGLSAGGFTVVATGTSGALGSGGFRAGLIGVANANITTSSIIVFSRNLAQGTLGNLSIFSQPAGNVYFVSDNAGETSTLNYIVVNSS